jgi:hypothetical protein
MVTEHERCIMNAKEAIKIAKYLTSAIESREECLSLAFDRGLGEGQQIEEWMLTEMLAKLVELREEEIANCVEGRHKYPIKKTTDYERCDLWWNVEGEEHWLEVKTIVLARDHQRGSIEEVRADLEKRNRLRPTDIFHHLTIIFPVESSEEGYWREELRVLYEGNGLSYIDHWHYKVDWNHEVLHGQLLLMVFCS